MQVIATPRQARCNGRGADLPQHGFHRFDAVRKRLWVLHVSAEADQVTFTPSLQCICIAIWQNPLLVHLIGQFSTLPGCTFQLEKKTTQKNSPWVGCKMYVSLRHQRVSRNTQWCIFEVFAVTRRPPAAPCGARSPILRIIHNELSLVSSHGWYPSSMTLNSLNSLSSVSW